MLEKLLSKKPNLVEGDFFFFFFFIIYEIIIVISPVLPDKVHRHIYIDR